MTNLNKKLKNHRLEMERQRLFDEIKKIDEEMMAHKENCKHKNVIVEGSHSNTGNFDPYCDYYSTTYKCKTCLACWEEKYYPETKHNKIYGDLSLEDLI